MVAWLTQSRDDMIQLHKPWERAAGSGFRLGAPKVLVPIALLDDPGTPRAHARGVRFSADGGFHVRRANAVCTRRPVQGAPGLTPALPPTKGTGQEDHRHSTRPG